MSRRLINLIGRRFGKLVVLSRASNLNKRTMWSCHCDCGNETVVRGSHLTNNLIKSCGCYRAEVATTHRMSHTKIYKIWGAMLARCKPENKDYGGRGISVCKHWHIFENFLADMGELNLDR